MHRTLYRTLKEQLLWVQRFQNLAELLAGLLELVPWVKQWHNELDPVYGERMGDYYEGFVCAEARGLGVTVEELKAWKPAGARTPRRRMGVAVQ